jgi:hypothetical protein
MDARELIESAFNNCARVMLEQLATMYGQRTSGSQWGNWIPRTKADYTDPKNGFELVPKEQLPEGCSIPGCLYFRTTAPHVLQGAVEQVAALTELPQHLREKVRMEMGPHGPELRVDEYLPVRPANEAWLILGPLSRDQPNMMIPWTAYPGRLMAGIDTEIAKHPADLAGLLALNLPFSVKSTKDKPPQRRS